MTTLTLAVPADVAEAVERLKRLDRLHARLTLPPINAATIRQAIQQGRP